MPQWVYYIIFVFALIFIGMIWAWWQRSKYSKATKDHILAEFWPEHGKRYKQLLPIEVNGIEIKAPRGHQCPRYFFDKESTFTSDYPDALPIPVFKSILQVQVPIVSWMENNPEPIHPYSEVAVVSSDLIDSLRDNDFMAFAMAAVKEIEELEKALAHALANTISKKWFYILLAGAMLLSLVSCILGFLDYRAVSSLKELWG
jgi:hypothetical protein